MNNEPRLSNGVHKRNSKKSIVWDRDNLFKDVNLKDIFKQEELELLLKDPLFFDGAKITENEIQSLTSSRDNSFDIIKKGNNLHLLFDRTNLILKFLKLSIEKLNHYQETSLAKGLDW
jgi:hypothetical protein